VCAAAGCFHAVVTSDGRAGVARQLKGDVLCARVF